MTDWFVGHFPFEHGLVGSPLILRGSSQTVIY